ncbi:MAG: DUF695 domain-containing protein [Ferruginibacter sp.]
MAREPRAKAEEKSRQERAVFVPALTFLLLFVSRQKVNKISFLYKHYRLQTDNTTAARRQAKHSIMKKQSTILFGLLFQALLSFSQEENWDVYMAQYDKGVGSTLINMSLKEYAPIKEFPFLLTTGVKLIKCSDDGLPTKDEFEVLYQISDKMKSVIDSKLKNKSSGTFSYQCERIDYYYLNDTIGIRKLLESAYQTDFPNYKYSINIKNDKNWEAYFSFLYPNDEAYEYMSNQKVILNLTKEGDNLSKPRQVDHWLYFKTEADRNKFITYALKEKFKVKNKKNLNDSKLKYQLQISRVDKVDIDSISKITIDLRKKAKELNGEYDGWETFVIKEK